MAVMDVTSIAPMLCKSADKVPVGDNWLYEPKWDGFRCIVVRDGDQLELTSRNDRPFTRYFPELLGPMATAFPERCVIDGEIVLPGAFGLDFDALLQRIHPAVSRINRLAVETPTSFVAFDLLADGDDELLERPVVGASARLEALLADARPPIHLTPASTDPEIAEGWFGRFEGAGLDGVVAKRLDGPYTPDKRTMVKVKHERTADASSPGTGSTRTARASARCSSACSTAKDRCIMSASPPSFTVKRRAELLDEQLEPLTHDAVDGHPWQGWVEAMAATAEQQAEADPDAGRAEPVERRQRPLLGPAPRRTSRRGDVRSAAERPLPPRRPARPLAS